jgi:hypothetical protein
MEPIIAHSVKPYEAHNRIERLVGGSYLELFARRERPNWVTWGNEVAAPDANGADDINGEDDFTKSIDVNCAAVRERVANGGGTPNTHGVAAGSSAPLPPAAE